MTEDRKIHHLWIDSSRTPVYVLTFPEVVTDADLEACCAARERWAARARFPVSWVVDLTQIRTLTAKQRKMMAEHLGRFEPHDLAHNLGSAIVVPNAFLRGIVTAVFWLRAPKFPHQSFATPREAVWWATSRHGAAISGSVGAGA